MGSLLQASDGKLYGTTSYGENGAVIFSFDLSFSAYTKLYDLNGPDAGSPVGSLMQASDGKLYGTTISGGSVGGGVIFSFDPSTSTYTKLKDFDFINGSNPEGSLMQASDGKLYGMARGGSTGAGVIFSFDPSSSEYTILEDFGTNKTGSNVSASLIQASDGRLYGMTYTGGDSGYGVIFSFDPFSSTFTKLRDFDYTNGGKPRGSLVQARDGKLYGMTTNGGGIGFGVIFSFDPSTSVYIKLKDFDYSNGAGPNGTGPFGTFIQTSDGKLYGMTNAGGSSDAGVIFSFDPSSTTYSKLMDFDGVMGAGPYGSLIQASDGKLYGMTNGEGGSAGDIFSFDPSTSTYTKLKDFDGINGSNPEGSLMQASDGKLYGMTTYGGSSGVGVIFSFDPSSSTYTKLKDFDDTNGGNPQGSLMEASDGKLYGMTSKGGNNNLGVIFSFDPSSSTFAKLKDYNGANGANPYIGSAFIEIKSCTDTTYFQDADDDGYGNPDSSVLACVQPAGYVTNNTDCDDTKASVNPGATEICGNNIDNNCNGQVDENCNVVPKITINNVTVNESKGVAVLTVSLSNKTSKPVGALYYTKDGTATSWGRHKDYKTKIGLLIIPAGSLTTTVSIKIFKDNIAEPTEYFDVILFRSLNGTIADKRGRVFITDGMLITNSKSEFMQREEESLSNGLEIKVLPNPAAYQFNLTVESNNKTGKINMKVMDVQGKLIETRTNVAAGQTIRFGNNYSPGSYLIQAVQGKQRRTIKMIKLPE